MNERKTDSRCTEDMMAQTYRKSIIGLIIEINNEAVLKFTYDLLISFKAKWGI